jgi:hypothetical protein
LNVNAHDNASLANDLAALDSELANWAGTRRAFATAGIGMAGNTRPVFRGLGYGPAEIQIPAVSANLPVVTPVMANQLRSLVVDRYRSNYGVQVPGRPGADFLDTLLHGWRPAIFTAGSGYGASIDPFGRGGVALGRDGNLVAAVSGRPIATGTTPPADSIDEAVNDPYESDPTGRFGGDSLYSFGELEALLRSNDFDVEMLPQRLRTRLLDLIQAHPEFANLFTTISKSDDSPVVSGGSDGLTSFRSTQRFLSALIASRGGGGLNNRQMGQLIAPELRLGRKLDVNRPFGNGVDDSPAAPNNGFGAIDEPREIAPGVLLPTTAGNALPNVGVATATVAGVFAAGPYEARAFSVLPTSGQTIPAAFDNPPPPFNIPAPRYNIMDRVDESVFDPNNPAFIHPFDIERDLNDGPLGRQVTARQLLARHIYVLLMALTRDYTFPSMAETFNTVPPRTTAATFNADVFKARRLAQWAVNLVDYRDPDAIMTRFVFDPTPFDGWSPPAEPAPPEFVVWGVEAPELIFSESLAFHDVRVRDIEEDTGTQKRKDDAVDPDPNTDQIRKPEGSLFLELYCPRSQVIGAPEQTTKLGVPRELYNIDLPTGVAELDLIRSAPPRPGVNQGVPVWRIAISERHDAASPKAAANPQLLRTANPDGFSPEVDHPDELSPAPPVADRLAYDRFIWFRDFRDEVEVADLITDNDIRSSGGVQMLPHQVFFAPSQDLRDAQPINPMRQLQPGQYLSLAPRVITRLGSRSPGAAYPGEPSDQRFEAFSGDGVVQFNHNDERVTPLLNPTGLYTAALPMVIGAFRPAGWDVDQFEDGYIGLNVSEPLANSYYPQPQFNLDATGNYPLVDSYIDYAAIANTARDIPADIDPALGYNRVPTPDGIEPALGTTPQYCTAFVERLADPTVPYDPLFNPYRVVDWISIDLNVFSGEELETKVVAAAARYAARSRQKNGFIGNVRANALFSNETNRPEDELADVAPVATGDFFALSSTGNHVYSSLSFLNTTTAEPGAATPATGSSNPVGLSVPPFTAFTASIGSEGAPEVLGNDRNLPGGPLDPAAGFGPGEPFTFARHNWLNRPFATHFELMMVPASSAGRLFEEFSVNVAGTNPEIYPTATSLNPAVAFYAPFRHLLNFFHSDRTLPSPPAAGAELAGLFDMVHTLPRFKGEVGLRQPRAMNLLGTNPPAPGNDPFFRSAMRPPLNIDYDNQRLAQVNLNTVSDFNVWVGVMQGHLNASEFNTVPGGANADQLSFQSFLATRRGYGVPQPVTPPVPTTGIGNGPINYDPENLSHRYPSQFVGMMRNHVWSSQFPTLRNDAGFDAQSVARRRGVNGTLLRVAGVLESSDPAVVANPHGAQFVRSAGQIPDATLSGDPQMNRDRDAFLRYQTLMRMPNLVSNNSQIYLIRTTMGFFEVDADSGNLGREYNEELGQNQRYRAMYIIDRSKEVGFEPGENLNARDVVLFESYAQ